MGLNVMAKDTTAGRPNHYYGMRMNHLSPI